VAAHVRWRASTLRIWHAEQVFDVNKLLFPVNLARVRSLCFGDSERLRTAAVLRLHAESIHAKWSAIASRQPYGTALRP
jgi:hypothetical protein